MGLTCPGSGAVYSQVQARTRDVAAGNAHPWHNISRRVAVTTWSPTKVAMMIGQERTTPLDELVDTVENFARLYFKTPDYTEQIPRGLGYFSEMPASSLACTAPSVCANSYARLVALRTPAKVMEPPAVGCS